MLDTHLKSSNDNLHTFSSSHVYGKKKVSIGLKLNGGFY